MRDFIFDILTSVLHMNLRDPHDIPFALPLMMAACTGLIIGFIFVTAVEREHKRDRENNDSNR
ncbi:MAG: hypothetical protein Kow0065_02970 [Methylomicrobium sp.]